MIYKKKIQIRANKMLSSIIFQRKKNKIINDNNRKSLGLKKNLQLLFK